jgi:lipoprotein-anchoring transpeptidase ErfK/SrfK
MNRRAIKILLFTIFILTVGLLIYRIPLFIGCFREYDENLPISPWCWQFRLSRALSYDTQIITGSVIGFSADNADEKNIGKLPYIEDTKKEIRVNIAEQKMQLWQDGKTIKEYIVSTGKDATPTRKGKFDIISKHEIAYGCGIDGQCWKMPYWLGIYMAGSTENGIHELPFINIGGVYYREGENNLGNKVSHGCIRLPIGSAKEVYDWADIGTSVIIY